MDQLIERLIVHRADHPEYGGRPVHLLNMEDDGREESAASGLVTRVETDRFSDVQGWVTSLMSWPSEPA